jgi:DNA-binding response OmpR family regulator
MSRAKNLIIDDDQDINNLSYIFLESQDYNVDSYTDAVDTLMLLEKVDIILFYLI